MALASTISTVDPCIDIYMRLLRMTTQTIWLASSWAGRNGYSGAHIKAGRGEHGSELAIHGLGRATSSDLKLMTALKKVIPRHKNRIKQQNKKRQVFCQKKVVAQDDNTNSPILEIWMEGQITSVLDNFFEKYIDSFNDPKKMLSSVKEKHFYFFRNMVETAKWYSKANLPPFLWYIFPLFKGF